MKNLKIKLTIILTSFCLFMGNAQNDLTTVITLLDYNSCTNRMLIKYQDSGDAYINSAGLNQFYYQLLITFTPVNGVPFTKELHNIQYVAAGLGNPWHNAVGTKYYDILLPDYLACENLEVDAVVNLDSPYLHFGSVDIQIDINDKLNDPIDSATHILENGAPVSLPFISIFQAPNADCVSFEINQFGNTINSTINGSNGLLTYEWTVSKRTGGQIIGSTTGPSIAIGGTGVYCLTVSNQNGASCTQCITVTGILSL